ncbi:MULTISPECIES: hypothetical protein [unclassified Saccharibacter]|uniref:hypothetical protein n=1 Tax=unclassified Saccharibacter TaxID=2648722 RepID=UPI001926BCE9|nr:MULTISPECIES: hypothetical protein [unclassified Saccharibacter]
MTNDAENKQNEQAQTQAQNAVFGYYGYVNPTTKIVGPLMSFFGKPNDMTHFVALTKEQYDYWYGRHCRVGSDGALEEYIPPAPPLKPQAQEAMQKVQQQASMVSAMGEVFGPKMRDYVKALRAILDGSDTTSTTLPAAPDDVTA